MKLQSSRITGRIRTLQKENNYNHKRSSAPPILNSLQKMSHERWLTSLRRLPDSLPESAAYYDGSFAIKHELRVYARLRYQTDEIVSMGRVLVLWSPPSRNAPWQMHALGFGSATSFRSCSSAERLCPVQKRGYRLRLVAGLLV